MTQFDSRGYQPIEEFEPLKALRANYIDWRTEHEEKFSEIPKGTPMRYGVRIQSTWWEESFSFTDTESLVLYHDLPIEKEGQAYLQLVCVHYGYLYGFRWDIQTTRDEYRRKTIQALIGDDEFAYDGEMVVFREGERSVQLTMHILEEGNVLLETSSPLTEETEGDLEKKLRLLLPNE